MPKRKERKITNQREHKELQTEATNVKTAQDVCTATSCESSEQMMIIESLKNSVSLASTSTSSPSCSSGSQPRRRASSSSPSSSLFDDDEDDDIKSSKSNEHQKRTQTATKKSDRRRKRKKAIKAFMDATIENLSEFLHFFQLDMS